MSVEQSLVDGTPPKKVTLSQVLDDLYERITGDGDRDEHFKHEAPPTPEQQAHRDLYVKLNQPDRLS